MAEPRRLSRRALISGAAVGVASVATSGGTALASPFKSDTGHADGTYSIEEVVGRGAPGRELVLKSGRQRVVPTGFPEGWNPTAGDLVVIHHETDLAYPYVEHRGRRWFHRNVRRGAERVIAERHA